MSLEVPSKNKRHRGVVLAKLAAWACLPCAAALLWAAPAWGQVTCGNQHLEPSVPPAAPQRPTQSGMQSLSFGCTIPDDGSVIDLLIVYTPAARVAAEAYTGNDIATIIADHLAFTNLSFTNSLVNTQWNLVGLQETSYVETGCQFTDKQRLDDPNDGFMDEVPLLAEQTRADVVGLMVADCGSAVLNCPTAICGVGAGNSFIWAGDITNNALFAHESGHTLGGAHCESYNFGTSTTIMALGASACSGGSGGGSTAPHYSNPDVVVDGNPTGDATHNNASRINDAIVAKANVRSGLDCNCNGILDADDIANGTSTDADGNGRPDECDCTQDGDCDDGLFCNGQEFCDTIAGECNSGVAPCVDDFNPCTVCVETTQQCNVPDDSVCDDGLFCNGQETCGTTFCLAGQEPCTAGQTCDENADLCIDGFCGDAVCDPGEDCNSCPNDCPQFSGASCGNGVCEAGDGEDCLSCAADCNGKQSGKPSSRFCCGDGDGQNPVPCSDPACGGPSACTDIPAASSCCGDGTCEGVEDFDNCAVDCSCDVPADCDDGVACTFDFCAGGICQNTPNNSFCPDDGIYCNGTESCDPASGCVSSGDPCASDERCEEPTQSCIPCTPKNGSCTTDFECCSGVCKANGRCR